jgi:hypothetical protein
MANQEQLAILKQGAKVWNEWREENPTTLLGVGLRIRRPVDRKSPNFQRKGPNCRIVTGTSSALVCQSLGYGTKFSPGYSGCQLSQRPSIGS